MRTLKELKQAKSLKVDKLSIDKFNGKKIQYIADLTFRSKGFYTVSKDFKDGIKSYMFDSLKSNMLIKDCKGNIRGFYICDKYIIVLYLIVDAKDGSTYKGFNFEELYNNFNLN